jgi:hypothetical protein
MNSSADTSGSMGLPLMNASTLRAVIRSTASPEVSRHGLLEQVADVVDRVDLADPSERLLRVRKDLMHHCHVAAVRLVLVDAGHDGQRELLPEDVRQLEIAVSRLCDLITDLRLGVTDELGVAAAIKALADRIGRHGFAIDVNVELAMGPLGEIDHHPPEIETASTVSFKRHSRTPLSTGRARRVIVGVISTGPDRRDHS